MQKMFTNVVKENSLEWIGHEKSYTQLLERFDGPERDPEWFSLFERFECSAAAHLAPLVLLLFSDLFKFLH